MSVCCAASICKKRNQCEHYCLNIKQSYYYQYLDYSVLGSGGINMSDTYMCGDLTQNYEKPYPLFEECISSVRHITPYTIGDVLYEKTHNGVEKCVVSSMTIKSNGTWKIRLTSVAHRYVFEINESEVGKTYFLTEEEAIKSNL
jgi:hypothetical protein